MVRRLLLRVLPEERDSPILLTHPVFGVCIYALIQILQANWLKQGELAGIGITKLWGRAQRYPALFSILALSQIDGGNLLLKELQVSCLR